MNHQEYNGPEEEDILVNDELQFESEGHMT